MAEKKQTKSQILNRYVKLVSSHDFGYAFADDHGEWIKGRDEWSVIAELQKQIDPDWIIFNDIAPEPYRVKVKRK